MTVLLLVIVFQCWLIASPVTQDPRNSKWIFTPCWIKIVYAFWRLQNLVAWSKLLDPLSLNEIIWFVAGLFLSGSTHWIHGICLPQLLKSTLAYYSERNYTSSSTFWKHILWLLCKEYIYNIIQDCLPENEFVVRRVLICHSESLDSASSTRCLNQFTFPNRATGKSCPKNSYVRDFGLVLGPLASTRYQHGPP